MDTERLKTLREGLRKYYPNGFRKRIAEEEGCDVAVVTKVLAGDYVCEKPSIVQRAIVMLDEAMDRESKVQEELNRVTEKLCPNCYGNGNEPSL